MKPSLTKNNLYAPYLLLLIQPIFMATNTIVARGGVEFVPPISLAFWRWFTVFIILFPFFFNEILKYRKELNSFFQLDIFASAQSPGKNFQEFSFYPINSPLDAGPQKNFGPD